MQSQEQLILGPFKAEAKVEKYNPGRTPEDGEPDEVMTVSGWFEAVNGEYVPITDPSRIAQLEETYGNKAEG